MHFYPNHKPQYNTPILSQSHNIVHFYHSHKIQVIFSSVTKHIAFLSQSHTQFNFIIVIQQIYCLSQSQNIVHCYPSHKTQFIFILVTKQFIFILVTKHSSFYHSHKTQFILSQSQNIVHFYPGHKTQFIFILVTKHSSFLSQSQNIVHFYPSHKTQFIFIPVTKHSLCLTQSENKFHFYPSPTMQLISPLIYNKLVNVKFSNPIGTHYWINYLVLSEKPNTSSLYFFILLYQIKFYFPNGKLLGIVYVISVNQMKITLIILLLVPF